MKKSALCFWSAMLFLLLSCGNELSIDNPDSQNKQAGTGTYITINSSSLARTILPREEDVAAIQASLTDFTFKGKDSFGNEVSFTESPVTFDQLTSSKFEIAPGTWSFTLSAKSASGIEFTGSLENQKIEAHQTNRLSFLLTASSGGGMAITVSFTDANIHKVTASLTKLDGSFTERTATFNSEDFTTGTDAAGTTIYSVTYSCDASIEVEELSSGTYHLVFDFYAEGIESPVNSIPYDVRVTGGVTTRSQQEVSLNETYTITYIKNEGTAIGDAVLPLKYSRKSEEIELPDMEKSGYVFAGWYLDESFTKPVESIETGSTGNKELYAAFINSITVKAGGSEDANIVTEPVDSIDTALSKIESYSASDVDWTIYIDGTVYGTYTLSLSSTRAKTLTFAGKNVNTGDDYTDILDGGSIYTELETAATIKGSVFKVYDDVPVIIRNLKLTHGNSTDGYGGAFYTTGNVTLEEGAWLTDNHTYYAAGAVMNYGTFTMKAGSRITNNSAKQWGGGVWNGSSATFIMEGGEISGNVCGHGAAVCHSGVDFRFSGSASIPAGSDPNNPQDFYLMDDSSTGAYQITVAGELTGETPVATLTFGGNYSRYEENVLLKTSEGLSLTSGIISKFEVIQPEDDSGTWSIDEDGYLRHSD